MSRNLLPAYSVFRVLANTVKSTKDVLKSFIATFYVQKFKKKTFLINDFASQFNSFYGFCIPNAVIKNVLVEKFDCHIGKGGWYTMNAGKIKDEDIFALDDYKTTTDELIDDFLKYASRCGADSITIRDDFINYFNGTIVKKESNRVISAYIIKIQNSNSSLKELIDDLNYGSIIYRGITMDLPEISSWSNELTIYLNTDILFDMNGINGEAYKKSIEEFLELVKEVNAKKNCIHLRYFSVTRTEVNRFFSAAKKILCNKTIFSQSNGMTFILNKCTDVSDVLEKQGLFYARLKKYGILCDETNRVTRIDETDIEKREEQENYINKNFAFLNFSDDFLDKIEELRNGITTKAIDKTRFIFLTRTDEILKKSKERTNITNAIGLSPTPEYMVTALWFHLNKGFGLTDLHSLDIVLRSKKIYAGIVADEQKKKIMEAQSDFMKKALTKEQTFEVIAALKQFSSKPEDITSETIDWAEELNDKTANQILESNEIERQKNQDVINLLKKQRDEANRKIQDNSKYTEFGEKAYRYLECLKKIGRTAYKVLVFFLMHIALPAAVVFAFAFVLKTIKKDELDWSFVFSNWISLGGTFLIAELFTWMRRIFCFAVDSRK